MKQVMGDEKKTSGTPLRTIQRGSAFTRDGGKTIYIRGQLCITGQYTPQDDYYYITELSSGTVEKESGEMLVEPREFVFMEEKLIP